MRRACGPPPRRRRRRPRPCSGCCAWPSSAERQIRSIFARLLDKFLGRERFDGLGLDFFAKHISHRANRVDAGKKIGHVQEAGLLEADIDERGLHPRQDPRHLPLVDISYDAALLVALEVELGQRVILDRRHPHLEVAGVD